jgi:hypothetical protein
MQEQKEKLQKVFLDWKGDLEQVDDFCLIGRGLSKKSGWRGPIGPI